MRIVCSAVLALLVSPLLHATSFSGSSGSLAARVTFEAVGGQLQVTLSNISPSDVLVPADVLTAVFFDLAGNPQLAPISADIDDASCILYHTSCTVPANQNVGGEWAYRESATPLTGFAQHQGISSTGLGVFGPPDLFPGPNLNGPDSPDGLQYGIVSMHDHFGTGNSEIRNTPLIHDTVVFLLSGLPQGFNLLTGVTNVRFQYGTGLSEPSFDGTPIGTVPEPATLGLLGCGIGLLGLRAWRRRS